MRINQPRSRRLLQLAAGQFLPTFLPTLTPTFTLTPSQTPAISGACIVENDESATLVLGQADFNTNSFGSCEDSSILCFATNVYSNDQKVVVADFFGRVKIFDAMGLANGSAAAVTLGQPQVFDRRAHLTEVFGLEIFGGRLIISDSGDRRVVIHNEVPTVDNAQADVIIGWPDFDVFPSTWDTDAYSLNVPRDVIVWNGNLVVADSGNNRVLIYDGVPNVSHPAAIRVLGQANFTGFLANRGGGVGAETMNQPIGLFADAGHLYVADTGNNRVLVFKGYPSSDGAVADVVIGQDSFNSTLSFPHEEHFSSPWDIFSDGEKLFVSDLGYSRVVIYDSIPLANGQLPQGVLGQPSLLTFVGNRLLSSPAANSLNQPKGLHGNGNVLFVADSQNNRVLGYSCPAFPAMVDCPTGNVGPKFGGFDANSGAGIPWGWQVSESGIFHDRPPTHDRTGDLGYAGTYLIGGGPEGEAASIEQTVTDLQIGYYEVSGYVFEDIFESFPLGRMEAQIVVTGHGSSPDTRLVSSGQVQTWHQFTEIVQVTSGQLVLRLRGFQPFGNCCGQVYWDDIKICYLGTVAPPQDQEGASVLSFLKKGTGGGRLSILADGKLLRAVPNPASDRLYTYFRMPKGGQGNLSLIDLNGQIVISLPVGSHMDVESAAELDVKMLASGIYLLVLSTDEGMGLAPRATQKV